MNDRAAGAGAFDFPAFGSPSGNQHDTSLAVAGAIPPGETTTAVEGEHGQAGPPPPSAGEEAVEAFVVEEADRLKRKAAQLAAQGRLGESALVDVMERLERVETLAGYVFRQLDVTLHDLERATGVNIRRVERPF